MLIISLCFFLIGGILFIFGLKKHKINYDIEEKNKILKKENQELEEKRLRLGEDIAEKWDELARITEKERELVEQQSAGAQAAFEKYCDNLDLYYSIKEHEFDSKLKLAISEFKAALEKSKSESNDAFVFYMDHLEKCYTDVETDYNRRIVEISANIQEREEELQKIRSTYSAVKEAQRREEEMALQADFYSLHLLPTELDTIALIEELKPRLPDARVLCMLIWTTYYQKQMSALCNNVLGANIVCGIYKITNKKSNMCYIGQATDMATRWKQHAKCGLGIDTPAQNKLYRAMQLDGLINFTFELLEECPRAQLNEKEKYYIDLYQSYEFGYNSTSGNK